MDKLLEHARKRFGPKWYGRIVYQNGDPAVEMVRSLPRHMRHQGEHRVRACFRWPADSTYARGFPDEANLTIVRNARTDLFLRLLNMRCGMRRSRCP